MTDRNFDPHMSGHPPRPPLSTSQPLMSSVNNAPPWGPPPPGHGAGPPPPEHGVGPPPPGHGVGPGQQMAPMSIPSHMARPGMPPPPGGAPQRMPPMAGVPPPAAFQTRPGVMRPPMGMRPPGQPVFMNGQPGVGAPPGPPMMGQQQGDMGNEGRPDELPIPFHGQAQYSHQLHLHDQSTTPTPTSDPQSRKSSRGPSPVSNQQYEMLEGQFSSSKPGTPQPGMQNTPPMRRSGSASSPLSRSPQPPTQYGQPPTSNPGFPGQQPPTSNPGYPGQQPPTSNPGFPGQQPPTGMPPRPNYQGQGPPLPGQVPPPGGQGPPFPGQGPPQAGQGPPFPGQRPPGQGGFTGGPPPPVSFTGNPPLPGGPPSSSSQPSQNQPPVGSRIDSRNMYPQMQPGPNMGQAGPTGAPPSGPMGYQGQPQQQYGQPPPPSSQMNSYPPQPPQQSMNNYPPQQPMNSYPGQAGQQQMNSSYPAQNTGLNSSFGRMHVGGDMNAVNLLHEKQLIPAEGVETPRPTLQHDFKKVNCSTDILRSTLNAIPHTQSLLTKSRLPLGILIHPFKDLSSLPVIQSSVIVRCRSCRTYINPFVTFVDQRRWRCNLCYRVNEMPDEFTFDPVSKTYGAPERRPEIRSATVEFIAPSEYMLRPPQPAVYLFVLDTSFSAVETGYLQSFCSTLIEELDRMPGDGRTKVGFITFDSAVRFYNLSEGLSTPQMLVVSDIDDVFLPSPDGLLVNLNECRDLVVDLLNELPSMFQGNKETNCATGAALQAAMKLMTPTGGRLTLMQGCLPNIGPGLLKSRENPNERAGKNIGNLGPATDFYKKLALDCSAQQIAIDTWFLSGQYVDIATVGCASKYSGGCCYHYPGIHNIHNPSEMERYESDLRRYLSRKIGFEAVMRIRCTKGLSIHTFHGNFFVRSTDLLSLPNINPDAGFGMQISIEESLTDYPTVSLQAALLYTSGKGERRIRVHTLCLPVTNQMSEVHANVDQQAVVCLLAKMAVDRSLSSSFSDAREAMINACVDSLGAFAQTLSSSQRVGSVVAPHALRLLPTYILAMLKSMAFRIGTSTKLDDRVYAMEQCKNLPLHFLMLKLYPSLYPVHALDEKNVISKGDLVIPQPPLLHLSSAYLDRHGAYVMDTGDVLYLWIGGAISDTFVQEVFDVPNFMSIQDGLNELPELSNQTSENLRTFIGYLQDQRPHYAKVQVIRDDSKNRMLFLHYMVEDRSEGSMSYYEFLQHVQKNIK